MKLTILSRMIFCYQLWFVDLNSVASWVTVLVGALGYFVLGALWYSPIFFSKRWISDLKLDVTDPKMKSSMPATFEGLFK